MFERFSKVFKGFTRFFPRFSCEGSVSWFSRLNKKCFCKRFWRWNVELFVV